jgi:hypothetical protein
MDFEKYWNLDAKRMFAEAEIRHEHDMYREAEGCYYNSYYDDDYDDDYDDEDEEDEDEDDDEDEDE